VKPFFACAVLSLGSLSCSRDAAVSAPVAAPVATNATLVISLGRDICQGCVDGARTKLAGVAGIGDLALNPGGKDFTLHYDDSKVQPQQVVAKLVAAGEVDAKVGTPAPATK